MVTFDVQSSLSGKLSAQSTLHGKVPVIPTPERESYDGDYEISPSANGYVLPTKDKVMSKDLEILPIPYYETTNESNGKTVYIAQEV